MHSTLYQERFGKLPPGQVVRHTCDNRMCINLDHMIPRTPADNSNDMVVRGRCNTHCGETRRDAKLSLKEVLEIAASTETQRVVGLRYGVSQSVVSRIRAGKAWPERGQESIPREQRRQWPRAKRDVRADMPHSVNPSQLGK